MSQALPRRVFPLKRLPPLAPAWAISRTHCCPRGQVLRRGELAHLGPEFRNQRCGGHLLDPWDGLQQLDRLLLWPQPLLNLPLQLGNGSLQKVQMRQDLLQQNAVIRLEVALQRSP